MNLEPDIFPLKLMETYFNIIDDAVLIYKADKLIYANKSAETLFGSSIFEKSATVLFGVLLAKEPFRSFGGVEIDGRILPVSSVALENDTHVMLIRLHDLADLERIDAYNTAENLKICSDELKSSAVNIINLIFESPIKFDDTELTEDVDFLIANALKYSLDSANLMNKFSDVIQSPAKTDSDKMIPFADLFAYLFNYLCNFIENKNIKIKFDIHANASDIRFYGNQESLNTLLFCVSECALETIQNGGTLTAKLKRKNGYISVCVGTNCHRLDSTLLRICFGELSLNNEITERRHYLGSLSQAFRIAKTYGGEIAIRCFETGGMEINILLPDASDPDYDNNCSFEPSINDRWNYITHFSKYISPQQFCEIIYGDN